MEYTALPIRVVVHCCEHPGKDDAVAIWQVFDRESLEQERRVSGIVTALEDRDGSPD